MPSAKLTSTLRQIRQQWGQDALRPLSAIATPAVIPTGQPVLDAALGIGGLPRGRLTEIIGHPTSGMFTLALHLMAQAQALGDPVVVVDMSRTFDPDYAQRCGVRVEDLWLITPEQRVVLQVARDLVRSQQVGLIVLRWPPTATHIGVGDENQRWQALHTALTASPCALVSLIPAQAITCSSPSAAIRLQIERQSWLQVGQDVVGYRSQVTILKNKLMAPGPPLELDFQLPGET